MFMNMVRFFFWLFNYFDVDFLINFIGVVFIKFLIDKSGLSFFVVVSCVDCSKDVCVLRKYDINLIRIYE